MHPEKQLLAVVETAPNPDSPRFQAMMSSMPDHMKEMVFSPRDELDLQKHMVTGATKDKELLESILSFEHIH
ncbi:hypothetical protein AK812_SmicGene22035 [Symbiodinium microadriaticum]|uniref:Uncharacterized protein n=1 Tax=Symbiodinium microadriaticum TaxID=2951 RepID=A0A1Q9DKZ1_SYMMI|nr:hypothetical protein AK812_SmicGene22035 [Symbiodinium microadriaticum]